VKICSIIISQMKRITTIGLSTLFIVIALACFRVEPVSADTVVNLHLFGNSTLLFDSVVSPNIITNDLNQLRIYKGTTDGGTTCSNPAGIVSAYPNGSWNLQGVFSPTGNCSETTGDYFGRWYNSSNVSTTFYSNLYYIGSGVWSVTGNPDETGDTRIISVIPLNNATSTNTVDFEVKIYLNPDDNDSIWSTWYIDSYYQNQPIGLQYDLWNEDLLSDGLIIFSTTTTLSDGAYQIDVLLKKRIVGIFGSPWSQDSVNHIFTVGSSTFWGDAWQSGISDIMGNSSATSTDSLMASCNLLSGFNLVDCLISVFWPSTEIFDQKLIEIKDLIDTSWPLGYISQTLGVFMATTSSSTLPIFNATIPDGVVGAGSSLTLDLADVVWIFNATSSMTSSSTETLGEKVGFYWNLVVYLALGFYILRRLMGGRLIPLPWTDEGDSWSGPLGREYRLGKKKGYWSNTDQYLND